MRWVAVPAKVIPYAAASMQWGWRVPWRRILRILWNWQWWLAVVVAALAAVWLPSRFFVAGAERDGLRAGVARGAEAGGGLFTGGRKLGFSAGVGHYAVWTAKAADGGSVGSGSGAGWTAGRNARRRRLSRR